MSKFGKGDRYANIDNYTDLISTWYKEIDLEILKSRVSERKKAKVIINAENQDALVKDTAYRIVLRTSLSRNFTALKEPVTGISKIVKISE